MKTTWYELFFDAELVDTNASWYNHHVGNGNNAITFERCEAPDLEDYIMKGFNINGTIYNMNVFKLVQTKDEAHLSRILP